MTDSGLDVRNFELFLISFYVGEACLVVTVVTAHPVSESEVLGSKKALSVLYFVLAPCGV